MEIGEDFDSRQRLKFIPRKRQRPFHQIADFQPPDVNRDVDDLRVLQHGPFAGPDLSGRNAVFPLRIESDNDTLCDIFRRRWITGLILRCLLIRRH